MTVIALGSATVGTVVPGCATAVIEGQAGITLALPDLQARIDAILATLALPLPTISFSHSIGICLDAIAQMQAAITFGIMPPDIAAQFAALQAALAALLADLASISVHADALAAFTAPLAAAGVSSYAYTGNASSLGAELDAAVAGDGITGPIDAVVMVTTDPAAWAALGVVVRVS